MKKMKVSCTFLFLLTTGMMYPVNWRCCLLPWLKQNGKKNKDLQNRLDTGDVELVILPTTVRTTLTLPAVPPVSSERLLINRDELDLGIVMVSAGRLSDSQGSLEAENTEVPRDGTPWKKAASFFELRSKFAPFVEQESRTPPLPRVETQEANLENFGILSVPSNSLTGETVAKSPVSVMVPGWEILESDSEESVIRDIVNSKDGFRHLSSDESMQSPVVVLSRSDSGVQTDKNKRVTFR